MLLGGMGIKHIEQLSVSELREVLQLNWSASEKFDGSYLEIGLDENGSYYSQRKGGDRCYSVSDWGDEGWTRSFRAAHDAGELVIDCLFNNDQIVPGEYLKCEVLFGSRPNTILYQNTAALVITSAATPELHKRVVESGLFVQFTALIDHDLMYSEDGQTILLKNRMVSWRIYAPEPYTHYFVKAKLYAGASQLSDVFEKILARDADYGLSVEEVLEIKLNKRHPKISKELWKEAKVELKGLREDLWREVWSHFTIFKQLAIRAILVDYGSTIERSQFFEGLVGRFDDGRMFKIVDRRGFSQANNFAHIVKYWLVGGRRPNRPSFLSRTKDWPKEKRLARLEVLRRRYNAHRESLWRAFTINQQTMMVTYYGELHERTKILFADVKKRIEDGR